MSQVGRISGPLLQENLIRNGIDLSFETDLVYLDVNNGRIGIKTTSPTNEIQNSQTTRTTNLIVDTEANFPILNFTNSTIQPFGGTNNILLDARHKITASNIKTGDIFIDDNYIRTTESNSPLEFFPNGTGLVNVFNKLYVDGNINLDGDLNVDGNIQLGDANTDSLVFNADIDSNIIPDTNNYFNLGSIDKRWRTIHSSQLNGGDIDAQVALLGTVSLGTKQGKIWYVSTNGDNDNDGDHQQGPFQTLDYAVTQAQSGDTIYILPGEYEETCPIVVPQGVTIRGTDIRNTIIKPVSSDNVIDIFKLNGESAVSDLTVKDFYYDSINDVGYAFRFASGATVTTRSPYIQNVTVITQGSVTSASDPRGFDQGDAGKGALVDGDAFATQQATVTTSSANSGNSFVSTFPAADVELYKKYVGWWFFDGATKLIIKDVDTFNSYVRFVFGNNNYNSSSGETITIYGPADNPSMLFHSVTFITPGVDALTMTNGARVEWLNSFTYFANRGLYALPKYSEYNNVVIVTGGSEGWEADRYILAGVYNNKPYYVDTYPGAPATQTILWQGTYWELTNSAVSESWRSNSDTLYPWDATDWYEVNFTGGTAPTFARGEGFNVGAELRSIGSATVYGNYGAVADGADTLMYLIQHNVGYVGSGKFVDNDPSRAIQTNEIVELNSGKIYYQTVNHFGDFRIGDNFFINQETGESSIVIDSSEVQGFGRLRVTDVNTGNVTIIDGEQISTGNLTFTGNDILSVDGPINFDSFSGTINLQDNTNVTGDVDITGDLTFDGTLNLMGNEATDTLKFNVSINQNFNPNTDLTFDLGSDPKRWNNVWTTEGQIGDIHIEDNFVTTDISNANLELRANGTGEIYVPSNNVQIDQNLTVAGTSDLKDTSVTGLVTQVGNLPITGSTTFTNFNIVGNIDTGSQAQFEEILFDGNVITTTTSNADLELRASGTGEIVINEQVDVLNNLQLADLTETGLITVTNNVRFDTANISAVTIQGNRITHNTGNDLDLSSTGIVRVGSTDVIIENATTVNGSTDIDDLTVNGNIIQNGNKTQTGNYTLLGEFDNGNILIEDNFITTTASNSDLELRASGTGEVVIDTGDTVQINNNLTVGGILEYQGFLTINGNVILAGNVQDGSLTITEDFNVNGNLTVDKQAQFEEILIDDNFITTTSSNADLELRASGTGDILLQNNTVINNNLSAGTMNVVDVNSISDIVADELHTTDNNIEINENYIQTAVSNSNLELRANGTGEVLIPSNNITIEQNLTVNGTTDIDDTIVNGTITHTGPRNQTGDYTLTGNMTVSGDFSITDQPFQFEDIRIDGNVLTTTLSNSDLDLRANGTGIVYINEDVLAKRNVTARDATVTNVNINNSFALENMVSSTDIEIFDNVITTTNSNSNLELRANGTGYVTLDNIRIEQNIISTETSTLTFAVPNLSINADGSLKIPVGTTLQRIVKIADETVDGGDADDILTTVYDGGDANTVFGPGDLVLDAGIAQVPEGNAGDLRFNTTVGLFEGFSQFNQYFGGVYSEDTLTSISVNNSNDIQIFVDGYTEDSSAKVAEVTGDNFRLHSLTVDDTNLNNNVISVSGTSDLTLTANGTGLPILNDFKFNQNLFLNESATSLTFKHTGRGYAKIDSSGGAVTPVGDESNKGATPQTGEIRWNTDLAIQEVYNGTAWIAARGIVNDVTASEFEEIIDFWTLVLG